ncbi:MAG: hypothetical protein QNJ78_16630 [Gammaproteobacteria bacterium]|nr:hypothetical protein [Gammaproteobacteria bacterium]
MNYKLPVLYKKLLILAVVFGPIVWLMFTDDGQRRTDTVVLWLFGEKEIKMDLQVLDSRFTEGELKSVYPDLEWQCQDYQTTYGNRLCVSRVGVFNGIPSHYISFFFNTGQLSAVKLNYRENNHQHLENQLRQLLGAPELEARTSVSEPDPDTVIQWRTPYGMLVMKKILLKTEEPSLFWLSSSHLTH